MEGTGVEEGVEFLSADDSCARDKNTRQSITAPNDSRRLALFVGRKRAALTMITDSFRTLSEVHFAGSPRHKGTRGFPSRGFDQSVGASTVSCADLIARDTADYIATMWISLAVVSEVGLVGSVAQYTLLSTAIIPGINSSVVCTFPCRGLSQRSQIFKTRRWVGCKIID